MLAFKNPVSYFTKFRPVGATPTHMHARWNYRRFSRVSEHAEKVYVYRKDERKIVQLYCCVRYEQHTRGKSVSSPSRLGCPYRRFTWQATAKLMLKHGELGHRIYSASEPYCNEDYLLRWSKAVEVKLSRTRHQCI